MNKIEKEDAKKLQELNKFVDKFVKELAKKHGKQIIAQINASPDGIVPQLAIVDLPKKDEVEAK